MKELHLVDDHRSSTGRSTIVFEISYSAVIPGTTNRLGAWGAQLAPRAFVRRIAGKLQG